ncbi:MAG: Hsp33 family molecular chaperone HslO [Lachnospiraceae bacterium]|nr:Hsp33 family molecular chaperone HslO [Lachnospiraceae bacterium]
MQDHIIRASADAGHIRAFAAYTKKTAEDARQAHNTSPVMTAALGRLLTAGALMGSMMKGDDLLTLQIKCSGAAGGLTVTADAEGHVKGYCIEPMVLIPARPDHKLDVAGALGPGYLRVIKDLGLKEPYIGETELVSGEIAEDLTYYFAQSEQTPSAVGLGVLMSKDNTVAEAGGFIVQLMPDAPESSIAKLEENLRLVKSVTDVFKDGKTPEDLLSILLDGLDMTVLEKKDVVFKCDCSAAKIEAALISIGKKDLKDLIDEGKEVEMGCSFCGKKYIISPEKLVKLYNES